jgi:hypothetical protein
VEGNIRKYVGEGNVTTIGTCVRRTILGTAFGELNVGMK